MAQDMETSAQGAVGPLRLEDLEGRRSVEAPAAGRVDRTRLADMAAAMVLRPMQLLGAPVLELSARRPYAANGLVDVFMPGRWDATSDLVFMDVIETGPEPGEWTGSVAYVKFQPPAPGEYLVLGHFTGYQITAHLNGPWGDNTAYSATTSDAGVVAALWNATAGEDLFFTVTFTGDILGYIQSIEVYQL
jgi:hypothetical protein